MGLWRGGSAECTATSCFFIRFAAAIHQFASNRAPAHTHTQRYHTALPSKNDGEQQRQGLRHATTNADDDDDYADDTAEVDDDDDGEETGIIKYLRGPTVGTPLPRRTQLHHFPHCEVFEPHRTASLPCRSPVVGSRHCHSDESTRRTKRTNRTLQQQQQPAAPAKSVPQHW